MIGGFGQPARKARLVVARMLRAVYRGDAVLVPARRTLRMSMVPRASEHRVQDEQRRGEDGNCSMHGRAESQGEGNLQSIMIIGTRGINTETLFLC